MSEQHKMVLRRANAAMVQGDYEGFLALCTDDTHWHFVGDRQLDGKVAVRQWMATAYLAPPRFTVHQMIAEGEFVTALGEITLKGEDGQDARHLYCDVWRIREGRLAALQAFVIRSDG